MNKEDIQNIKDFIDVWELEQADYCSTMYVYKKDIKTFKKIIDKNISKPVNISSHNVGFCPRCRASVWQVRSESKYCFRCGQKLKWE